MDGPSGDAPLRDGRDAYLRSHLIAVTVVPDPGDETISNSSMSRRVPGRPSPRLLAVEKPSCIARLTSAIPGPASRATTDTPARLSRSRVSTRISPSWAYFR